MSQAPHNSSSHDKHFYDSFLLVLGILVAVAVVLAFVSRAIALNTQHKVVTTNSAVLKATNERLAPVGKVAVSGEDNSALEPAKIATQAVAAADLPGDQVFNTACTACHGAGIAGAPKMGDKAAWGPRLAQGMPTLYKHAMEGFQGKAGFMPAKGGRMDISDASISKAVDYMVAAAK